MSTLNSGGVLKELSLCISDRLEKVGLMHRIFSRAKSPKSLKNKIESNPDYGISKKIQDLIGIRVVLYFSDDIETVREIISNFYTERSNDISIDEMQQFPL